MSKPQKLGEILPAVLQDIERRCKPPTAEGHAERVLSAVGGFMSHKPSRPKRSKRKVATRELF